MSRKSAKIQNRFIQLLILSVLVLGLGSSAVIVQQKIISPKASVSAPPPPVCPSGQFFCGGCINRCVNTFGQTCNQYIAQHCSPTCTIGEKRCGDGRTVQTCLPPGSWTNTQTCGSGQSCRNGTCVSSGGGGSPVPSTTPKNPSPIPTSTPGERDCTPEERTHDGLTCPEGSWCVISNTYWWNCYQPCGEYSCNYPDEQCVNNQCVNKVVTRACTTQERNTACPGASSIYNCYTDVNNGQVLSSYCVQNCEKEFNNTLVSCYWPEFCVPIDPTTAFVKQTCSTTPGQPLSLSPYKLTVHSTSKTSSNNNNGAAEKAVDGIVETYWSSGAFPTQWIRVDLGKAGTVSRVSLIANQTPNGFTVHKIYASQNVGSNFGTLVYTFSQDTKTGTELVKNFSQRLSNVRYITIETTKSPSWVAWSEIKIWP